ALEGQNAAPVGLRGPLATDSASGAVREALARAQDVYAALLLQIREARPEYATLVTGTIAPVRAVMAKLAPDEALLEYLVGDSASGPVWLGLHGRAPPVGSGVLALAPRVDVLPGSAAEVAAIGRLYGTDARVLVGAHASKRALRDAAAGQSIIHFATYGVLNK